jgi:hypothetical protein
MRGFDGRAHAETARAAHDDVAAHPRALEPRGRGARRMTRG